MKLIMLLENWNTNDVYFMVSGVSGKLEWIGNWISYIDTMLQFSILGLNTRELYLPTRMQRVCIDPHKHKQVNTLFSLIFVLVVLDSLL